MHNCEMICKLINYYMQIKGYNVKREKESSGKLDKDPLTLYPPGREGGVGRKSYLLELTGSF